MVKRLSIFCCLIALLCGNWITVPRALTGTLPQPPPALRASEEVALAIVVNKTNPVENLSSNDLRSLLLGEQRTWANGRRVTIVMREPGQPERLTVLKAVCRMTDSDYIRYFLQAQFTGNLQATPKVLATTEGMRKFVFNVPGAVGYIRASEVDASVKVVRINGRWPGEAGYKLRLVTSGTRG